MLHVLRTGADVPLRATGDADYGVPPHVLRDGALVAEIQRLGLRVGARSVRSEERDATDLWRCLEVALADGVTPADFATPLMRSVPAALAGELGRGGPALAAITAA